MTPTIEDHLLSKLDFKINQDWAAVTERSLSLIEQAKTRHSAVEPYGNATFYHIGQLGSVSHHHISKNWHNVVGPWTYKFLPWLETMLADMAELEPRYAISVMIGDGAEHVDFDDVPTAFNYPVATTDAVTYVRYNDMEYTYPSITNEPWLLNTQYPHGVRNNEFRVVFNVHFSKPYPVVKSWFAARPNLVYG